MNFSDGATLIKERITIHNHSHKLGLSEIIKTILEGLTKNPKRISSMFFYDARGYNLFKEITQLDEYYLTRIEKSIIEKVARTIGNTLNNYDIIEIGSGDSSKICVFLENIPESYIKNIRYVPFDIEQSAMIEAAQNLTEHFPDLEVHGIVGDFVSQLHHISARENRLFCFFGSTLGNLTKMEIRHFFAQVSDTMLKGEHLLLGIDKVKEISVLEKAYNDSKGITESFNKNILNVVNTLIESNFNLDNFEHLAFYNENEARIEMHLRSTTKQKIVSPYSDSSIVLEKGETIHTENSHKFTDEMIDGFAQDSGYQVVNRFTDPNNWFSIVQLQKI